MSLRVIMVVMLILSTTLAVAADAVSHSVNATADYVKLVLSLPKKVYIEGEPIVASVSLINKSSAEELLAEPSTSSNLICETVEFQIKAISSVSDLPSRMCGIMPGPPSDYYWKFAPGGSKTIYNDLQWDYTGLLPVGEYKVRATYFASDDISYVWHGKITTPYLEFSIVSPSGDDVNMAKTFKDAHAQSMSSKSALKAAESFEAMRDVKTGRRFASYAGYFAAFARYFANDKKGYIADLEAYVKDYPNIPHYSEHSWRLLGEKYYYDGKYESARSAFSKLPDSYEKNHWIKKCEEKL